MLELIYVLIIDTGISHEIKLNFNRYISSAEYSNEDHGSAITGLVISGPSASDKVCSNVKIDICKAYPNYGDYVACLNKATLMQYDYINISLSGPDYQQTEKELLQKITSNSIVNVAAGNNGELYYNFYPSGLKGEIFTNFNVITNLTSKSSNFGNNSIDINGTNVLVYSSKNTLTKMTGTSMSTAIYTHKLLVSKCKELYNLTFKKDIMTCQH